MMTANSSSAADTHRSITAASNGGGEGKTMIAIAVEAAQDLLGRPPKLIDIDQGLGSLAFQRAHARSLDWDQIPSADAVCGYLEGHDVVFDFGANLLASGAPVLRLYDAVSKRLAADGYRCIVLVPISTNKPGAVGAARAILRSLSHLECHPVLVDRDGSAKYDEEVADLSAIKMPHLQPALQEFRTHLDNSLKLNLADAIRNPPSGWVYATDLLGMWLQDFASQPQMVDILGGDISGVLRGLGRRRHARLSVYLDTMQQIHDGAIADMQGLSAFLSNVQRDDIWKVLSAHGLTPSGLRAAAEELELAGKS